MCRMLYIIELPNGQQFRMRDADQAYYAAHLAWAILFAPEKVGSSNFRKQPTAH